MILRGVLPIIFGVLLLIFPGTGVPSLAWVIAIYAFIFGVLLISWLFACATWGVNW